MNKQNFLHILENELYALPENDRKEFLDYYSEMIDDRIEDGMSEEEAVDQLGMPSAAARKILLDMPFKTVVKTIKPKRPIAAWEIVLLIVGAPLWIPIIIALAAVCLSLYIALWSVVVSVYAADAGIAVGGLGSIALSVFLAVCGNGLQALFYFGSGICLIRLSGLLFMVCNKIAFGIVYLTKQLGRAIKFCFIGRRGRNEKVN